MANPGSACKSGESRETGERVLAPAVLPYTQEVAGSSPAPPTTNLSAKIRKRVPVSLNRSQNRDELGYSLLALPSEFGPKPALHRRAVALEATSLYGERIRLWGQPLACRKGTAPKIRLGVRRLDEHLARGWPDRVRRCVSATPGRVVRGSRWVTALEAQRERRSRRGPP